jgi:hypothetical protein
VANPRSSADRRRPAIYVLKPSPYRASGLVHPPTAAAVHDCLPAGGPAASAA